jgi:acylphosphatase
MKDESSQGGFHARITGRVQGVGFRYNTRRKARSLRLTGWVKNNPDGSVEVRAEGDKGKLDAMISWLEKGPTGARVEDVQVSSKPYSGKYSDFGIEY